MAKTGRRGNARWGGGSGLEPRWPLATPAVVVSSFGSCPFTCFHSRDIHKDLYQNFAVQFVTHRFGPCMRPGIKPGTGRASPCVHACAAYLQAHHKNPTTKPHPTRGWRTGFQYPALAA